MARPTREADALRQVSELADDLSDEAAGLVTWAEHEMSTAAARFDKPGQARIAGLAITAARIMRLTSQIKDTAR